MTVGCGIKERCVSSFRGEVRVAGEFNVAMSEPP